VILDDHGGGWLNHPDNPLNGGSSTSRGRSRSFGRGEACPVCDQADKKKRCSVTGEGFYRCWNFRKATDRSDFAWQFQKLAQSGDGGEWGCWTRANRCERCGIEDSRCWKNKNSTVFCANHLNESDSGSDWRFVGPKLGKSGQTWGRWSRLSRLIKRASRTKSTATDEGNGTVAVVEDDPKDYQKIHKWIWEQASPFLQGRFVGKLADASITDTAYSRYLTAEAITEVEKRLEALRRAGVWSAKEIEDSGWFYPNKSFESTYFYKCALLPGRVIAYYDLDGELALVRGNAEVTPFKEKRNFKTHKVKLQPMKYQHPKKIKTRPYFPKLSREKLSALKETGTKFVLACTEGEDKVEFAAQNFSTFADGTEILWVSLAGVWNFTGNEDQDLHPEFVNALTAASDIVICFDSDVIEKEQVGKAMTRLAGNIVEETSGRLIPLRADWQGLFAEFPNLASPRWGLDDLWGHLRKSHQDPVEIFERLLSPDHTRMVKRYWFRKGNPWKIEEQPPLLTLTEGRIKTHETINAWFEAGLYPLRSAFDDRVAVAATCGLGKTFSTGTIITERMNRWQASPGFAEATSICQELERLEQIKALTLPDTPERWSILSQIQEERNSLDAVYQRDLGGQIVFVFKDKQSLFNSLNDYVLPKTGGVFPPWLARRTGREEAEPEIPMREQIVPGSLACAHHEATGLLGEQRHSPSAGACQHCVWGQTGQCGFLDSLKTAHLAPVVFATTQAVVNASREIEDFPQIVCDEALDIHLVESMEIALAVRQMLASLQRGQAGGWYTINEIYTEAQIDALVTVFSEVVAAFSRYNSATPSELRSRGDRIADWCDSVRIAPYLSLLADLRPLRWNYDKNEVESASFFPWERIKYKVGPSGTPIHQETFGDDQKIEFEYIPLRATSEILGELYQAIVENKPGSYLNLERVIVEVASSEDPEEISTRRRVKLHMTRPYQHLIRALRNARVLNLDATPNQTILDIFLPDMRLVKIEAEWKNTELVQVLSGPMGRATSATIKQILPLAAALGTDDSVLLFSHKVHTEQVDIAQAKFPIPGLLTANDAAGVEHSMAWYNYQDRAIDNPVWKQTRYMILTGAHRTNIGHTKRIASMLRRFVTNDRASSSQSLPTKANKPYRVESYGPQGYELVVQNEDPLLDALIEHERIASLEQACQRPRPVSREKPLTIILMRSDPMPAPYNRYVRVVSSIDELLGVTFPGGNRANYARHLEALYRHSEVIWQWFAKFHTLPNPHQVEDYGKFLYGIGGNRGRKSAIKQALALFAAQILPSLQANENIAESRAQFLEDLSAAAADHYDINVCASELHLSKEAREAYWVQRYRQGDIHTRLVCWVSTQHLDEAIKQALEAIEPIYEVLKALREAIIARQRKPPRPLPVA
jgi:hypothetical protein